MTPFSSSRQHLFWWLHCSAWCGLIPVFFGLGMLTGVAWQLALLGSMLRQTLGFLLTLALWRAYRCWPERISLHHGALAILLCLACVSVEFAVLDFLRLRVGVETTTIGPALWFGALVMRFSLYITWSALYFFIRYWLASQEWQQQLATAETARIEAELATLRAQINPHFLFNALNSILAEADDNPNAVKSLAQALADYLRYSLQQKNHFAPLKEEVSAISGYLRVEQARFEERLVATLELPSELLNHRVPAAVLLPLVENAIKYGMQTSPQPLCLRILAHEENRLLHLVVQNSGHWIEEVAKQNHSTKVGLENLQQRLTLLYHGRARLMIQKEPNLVTMEVILPLQEP